MWTNGAFLSQFFTWFQAANEHVVLKLLSVGPLGTLLAFTGLGQVLSSLHVDTSTQVTATQANKSPTFYGT